MQHVKTLPKVHGRCAIVVPDNLDGFRLRDQSPEDSDDLPPDVLAQEIADDLQAALGQVTAIAEKAKPEA